MKIQDSIFWDGIVEDNADPLFLGRVRVRVPGPHSMNRDDIPTTGLPWAHVIYPPSTSGSGIGQNPHPPEVGTWVKGYWQDGQAMQQPVVIGVVPGINLPYDESFLDKIKDFDNLIAGRDINGTYPRVDYVTESDTNKLARPSTNDFNITSTIVKQKEDERIVGIPIANNALTADEKHEDELRTVSGTKEEPTTPWNAQYPFNKVKQSSSGHITEEDDTPGYERLNKHHSSGTFEEIHPNGSKVTKIKGDKYEIILHHHNVYVKGAENIVVDGAQRTTLMTTKDLEVFGTTKAVFHSDVLATIEGNFSEKVLGNKTSEIEGNNTIIVHGNDKKIIYGNKKTEVFGDNQQDTGGNEYLNVQENQYEKIRESISTDVQLYTYTLTTKTDIVNEAKDGSITIKATKVGNNNAGNITVSGDNDYTVKFGGDTILSTKGAWTRTSGGKMYDSAVGDFELKTGGIGYLEGSPDIHINKRLPTTIKDRLDPDSVRDPYKATSPSDSYDSNAPDVDQPEPPLGLILYAQRQDEYFSRFDDPDGSPTLTDDQYKTYVQEGLDSGFIDSSSSFPHLLAGLTPTVLKFENGLGADVFGHKTVIDQDKISSWKPSTIQNNNPFATQDNTKPIIQIPQSQKQAEANDIPDMSEPYPESLQISPNVKLGQVTSRCGWNRFHYVQRNALHANMGLSAKQILRNLQNTCYNIVEPLVAVYGSKIIINSGFRGGHGRSQHNIGQAVDLRRSDLTTRQDYIDWANEIVANKTVQVFDQFILEYNNRGTSWLHISYSSSRHRHSMFTLHQETGRTRPGFKAYA